MAETVYILCALTSCTCAAMLLRAYRRNRTRMLLWTSMGFVALGINNILLFVDLVALPEVDLSLWRDAAALLGVSLLVYGLICDSD